MKSVRWIIFPLLLMSCKDNPVVIDDKYPIFYLTVEDSDKHLIRDVAFHYIFYLNTDFLIRHAVITYALPQESPVTILILNALNDTVATPLQNQVQPAGMHAFFFED